MAWWAFAPYVPAATWRARAQRELTRRFRKRGREAEPIVAHRGRKIAITFWGTAWCDNLERYADFANRLPRGRTYVRNGSVLDLAITAGTVRAHVAGSELYEVTIRIAPMATTRWRRVVTCCTGRIGSLVGLLRGELSPEVLAVLAHASDGLFPEPREMTLDCSCPDDAGLCKHIAAVLYGVGIRLDVKPELFFTLRQVDQAELLTSATSGTATTRARNAPGKRIAPERLADVFGIAIEPAAARTTARSRNRRSPSRNP